MVFVYPLFLWALSALAIPVIIHLFNFRRYKKVYFTNVKFLKELQLESKSRSRLKELLVLLCRCLAIAALVLAFCQPILPEGNAPVSRGAKAISLYIDNSFSMENINAQGPLLEVAKTRAKELVNAFGASDRFQIITNDFEGKHQRLNTKDNAISVIDAIKISPASRQLSDVLKRQREFLNGTNVKNKRVFVLSDAQRSTFDLDHATDDSTIRSTLIPLGANLVNNVYVDTCWFESPLQQKGFIQKLHAVIVNNGNSDIETGSAKLFLNEQQIAISSFSLLAQSKSEVLFTFECRKEGFNFGSVKIEDYPVTFDDELFFAFNSRISLAVTLINGRDQPEANPLNTLFKSDSLFKFKSFAEQSIDYNFFKTSNVIVLNQLSELSSGLISELVKFTAQDGAIVIIPPVKANTDSYNRAFLALQLPTLGAADTAAIKTERIETAQGFYSGVFEKTEDRINLPLVNRHYKLNKTTRSRFERILTLQNGDPLLGVNRFNNSFVYLFSSPLEEGSTNFNKHALFVPTFYQAGFKSVRPGPLSYAAGDNVVIQLKNSLNVAEQPPHIRQVKGTTDIIPEARVINNGLFLYTRNQISAPGFYTISRAADTLMPLAFNYSRRESDLKTYDLTQLEQIIAENGLRSFNLVGDSGSDLPARLLAGVEGKKLWKLFIILALMFLVAEVALLRLLK